MIGSEKKKFRPLFFSLMANSIASRLVMLSRRTKRAVMVVSDAVIIPGCLAFSLWLVAPASAVWWSLWPWLTSVGVAFFCLVHYGLYRSVIRFLGLELVTAAFKIAVITTAAVVISIFLISSSRHYKCPRTPLNSSGDRRYSSRKLEPLRKFAPRLGFPQYALYK